MDKISKSEKIKVGIIGYGVRGKEMVRNIRENDTYQIMGISEIEEESLKEIKADPEFKNIEVYKDYRKLLEREEIEAVFIFTPQFTHKEIAINAFNSGKSVYCEKPLALTVKECDEIINASKKAGKVLMVGQQMRYHAHLNKMKEIIDKGEVGKPIMLWLTEFRDPFAKRWSFDKKKSGGLLVEKNCHHFDFFNWFVDSPPIQVFASGAQDVIHEYFGTKSDILDNAWVIVDYENGARAMLGICMFAGLPRKNYEPKTGVHMREIGVIGSKGMIRTEGFELGREKVEVRFSSNKNRVLYHIEGAGTIPNPYNGPGNRGILIRFAQCIREGIQPEASGEVGKLAVVVSLAAEKSVEEKRIVKISEILEE